MGRCWIRKSGAQFVYPATILHSGLLPASAAAAGGISFAPRRLAYRHGQQLPTLHLSGKVDAAVLNAAEYFVTVHLGELLPAVRAEAPPPREARLAGVGEEGDEGRAPGCRAKPRSTDCAGTFARPVHCSDRTTGVDGQGRAASRAANFGPKPGAVTPRSKTAPSMASFATATAGQTAPGAGRQSTIHEQ